MRGGTAAPRTILVVDDDEVSGDLVRRWVAGRNDRVVSARDGRSALALMRGLAPDVVVLDAYMPGLSGFEVLAEMRADPALAAVPVVLASSDDVRERGMDAGASDVMRKPLIRRDLCLAIDMLAARVEGDVLIVDDNPDAGELTRRIAERAGLRARLATGGLQALEMARHQPPGAIVLDLHMPELDGFAVMEMLAGDPALRAIPVLVLSCRELTIAEYGKMQGRPFCAKGVTSPRGIVEGLRNLMGRAAGPGEPRNG